MEQFFNNRSIEILNRLLTEPAESGQHYSYNLQSLVESFPQSGLIRALLAQTNKENQANVRSAAAHYNSRWLYSLINAPEALTAVDASKIIFQTKATNGYPVFHSHEVDEASPLEPVVTEGNAHSVEWTSPVAPTFTAETVTPEIAEDSTITNEAIEAKTFVETEIAPAADQEVHQAPVHTEIEDDVYDEITGVDQVNISHHQPVAEEKATVEEKQDVRAQEEKLISDNLASTDFFVFEKAYPETEAQPPVEESTQVAVTPQQEPVEEEKQDVSKYHDELMPYTFLWWLDKTRQEHADVYQPYAPQKDKQAIKTFGDPRLQQLYYESIFQVTPPEEIAKQSADVEFDMSSKTDRIIGKFIQEDPHISTPSADKLDNENKAKKSAEDSDEMVSETLAKIYTGQMLYHKAIATYKKLMLKFPEKSRYFADHIEQLEKKIN